MTFRRLLLAIVVMATPCGWVIAQEQTTPGPKFVPLDVEPPAIKASEAPAVGYYSVSGAVEKPGVYEFSQGPVTVGDLAKRAVCKGPSHAALVRPLRREEVQAQIQLPGENRLPYRVLQSSRIIESPDEVLQPGDLVVFRPISNGIEQAVHQAPGGAANGKVELVLANLTGRPIHAQVKADQANVLSLAQSLGIPQEKVAQHAIVVLRSTQSQNGAVSNQMVATEPLPAGTILLFDPLLIQLDQLHTESIEKLTQSQEPIRVASKPNEESRTDVPRMDLTEQQDAVTTAVPEPAATINTPQFINEPTPTPEDELETAAPQQFAEADTSVQMLDAPPEGAGMYDSGSNLIDVERLLANNDDDLPPLEETPFPPAPETGEMEVASTSNSKSERTQASLLVIAVLVGLIASVLGYYLFNTRSAKLAKAKAVSPKRKPAVERAPVKRPNMLAEPDDAKVAAYREKIEQKKKLATATTRREEDLHIDALINDFLPVKEEEMVITRTFNLPGIGQSFRIDPATTELQGPHFRQAANLNRKSRDKVSAQVGQSASNSATQRPEAMKAEASRPSGQAYRTIHKGGSGHFGSGK